MSARNILDKWEKDIGEFEGTQFYTIDITTSEDRVFYENITSLPAQMKIAIIVVGPESHKISFAVFDQANHEVVKLEKFHEAVLNIEIKVIGDYKIVISNINVVINSIIGRRKYFWHLMYSTQKSSKLTTLILLKVN